MMDSRTSRVMLPTTTTGVNLLHSQYSSKPGGIPKSRKYLPSEWIRSGDGIRKPGCMHVVSVEIESGDDEASAI